jgi:hypothetical protein
MLGEGGTPLDELLAAIRKYQAREVDPGDDDLKALRAGIDALKNELARGSTPDTAGTPQGRASDK